MIMHLPTGRNGQALALAIGILIVITAWFGAISPARDLYRDRADRLSKREVLLRDMHDLAATLQPNQSKVAAATDNAAPNTLLRGASDALAGAELQQRVQGMAGAVGARLTSTEALTADPVGNYRRIGLRVTLSAPWPVFIRLLAAVRLASPRMLVDDLRLSTSKLRGGDPANTMNGGFIIFAFGPAGPWK
jgi:general secretion pathway protein M